MAMEQIDRLLQAHIDEGYAAFQRPLLPDLPPERILGVRTPVLRQLARQIDRDVPLRDAFLAELPHASFEEDQLHFFLLCLMRDFDACLTAVDAFLPYVNNWATCDQSFPKVFVQHKAELLPSIDRWLASSHIYTVRYAVGALMRLYLDEDFAPEHLQRVLDVRSNAYYIRMMVAWYVATGLSKQWDAFIPVLQQRLLEPWTHRKAIQKARESLRITPEQKQYLNTLK